MEKHERQFPPDRNYLLTDTCIGDILFRFSRLIIENTSDDKDKRHKGGKSQHVSVNIVSRGNANEDETQIVCMNVQRQ